MALRLSRNTGRVLYVLRASSPPVPAPPVLRYATAAREKPPCDPAPCPRISRPDPGVDDRPRPGLRFDPSACNPFSLWNCLLLGHWTEFRYSILMGTYVAAHSR
jgi:hypothetical protein